MGLRTRPGYLNRCVTLSPCPQPGRAACRVDRGLRRRAEVLHADVRLVRRALRPVQGEVREAGVTPWCRTSSVGVGRGAAGCGASRAQRSSIVDSITACMCRAAEPPRLTAPSLRIIISTLLAEEKSSILLSQCFAQRVEKREKTKLHHLHERNIIYDI